MPPVLSRPLKQSKIGIFEARTSDGLFKGFGLSNLQQVNQINLQGAHINNGNGDIITGTTGNVITGNAQVSNSLNTSTTNGISGTKSNAGNWGPRSDNRYRADNNSHRQNYRTNAYYNGDRDDILEKQRARSKMQRTGKNVINALWLSVLAKHAPSMDGFT